MPAEPEPATPGDVVHPTALVSWSHRADDGVTPDGWRDQVFDLLTLLRRHGGIDAELDLLHQHDPDVDWTRWGPDQVETRDFVLVVINAAWRQAWAGRGDPSRGAGAAGEANALRGMFNRDRNEFLRRVKLLLLPGVEGAVPDDLQFAQRFRISEISQAGLVDLLRVLTGQPELPTPTLGPLPALPPRTLDTLEEQPPSVADRAAASRTVSVSAADSATATEQAQATVQPSDADVELERIAADIALLESALRRLPQPEPGEGPHLPWFREWERVAGRLAVIRRRQAQLRAGRPAAAAADRLAALSGQLDDRLNRTNRCWLVLALAPAAHTVATPAVPESGHAGGSSATTVDGRRSQFADWVQRAVPVPPLDVNSTAFRQPGRVVFTGELLWSGTPAGLISCRWRWELSDDGAGIAAAVVSLPPEPEQGTGTTAPLRPDQPLVDAEVAVLVRRDLLETWLLTQLELLVDQAGRHGVGVAQLQAALLLPQRLELPNTHRLRPLGVRLVDEVQDGDGEPAGLRRVPRSGPDLPLDASQPEAGPVDLVVPPDPAPRLLVRTAHTLATMLLEHFAVEETAVLRADGTLDAFAAATADRQAVHQHAIAIGLPVDELGPAERRRRSDELHAQARQILRP